MPEEEISGKSAAAQLREIPFKKRKRKRKKVLPNVSSADHRVENLTGFSSLDPAKASNEFMEQKYFELILHSRCCPIHQC